MEPATVANGLCTSLSSDRARPRSQYVEEPEVKVDRSHQLGRTQSTRPHTTQYHIDTRRQLNHINDQVLSDECIPCLHCPPRSRRCAVVVWLWSLIRSETFLYLLHISSIAFGAVNNGLELRRTNAALSLVHSSTETAIALLVIFIRTANGFTGYREMRSVISLQQDLDAVFSDIHVHRVRRLLTFYLIGGALLFTVALTFFFVFFHLLHLGWTTLTNNFCLVTILVLWDMYTTMINVTAVTVREDRFRIATHEALDIIASMSTTATSDKQCSLRRFISAVKSSQLFAAPDYVSSVCQEADNGVTTTAAIEQRTLTTDTYI